MIMHLTTKQVSEMLGVSKQTVDNYRKKGFLFGFRYTPKGKWLYKIDNILRFKEGQ